MLETVQGSAYEKAKPGVYPATYMGREVKETKLGKSYLWTFKMADGKFLTRFAGDPVKPPTINTRHGKFLCALAGKPPGECQVDADLYIGKQYLCIVIQEGILDIFTPCA